MNAGGSLQYAKKRRGEQTGVVMECKYSLWTEYGWGAIKYNMDLLCIVLDRGRKRFDKERK